MPITFKGINKKYNDRAVLKDVSFRLEDREFTCITGQSGVGKTTLLNIIAGLAVPDGGEISGFDSNHKISAVFQEDRLLPWFNALKNVAFVLPHNKKPEEKAGEILNSLGLNDEDIKKNVSQLSGGMRRRVEIARALAADYELLLLDEPFKGLDEATKHLTIDYLLHSSQKKTVVMITHDHEEIAYIKNKIPVNIVDLQTV